MPFAKTSALIINWRKPVAKTLFLIEKRRKLKDASCENAWRARLKLLEALRGLF